MSDCEIHGELETDCCHDCEWDALRAELAETKAALAAAERRAQELERELDLLKSPDAVEKMGVLLAAEKMRADDACDERDEANARALAAEDYARKAEQFATAKADEHYRGVTQAARDEALEDAEAAIIKQITESTGIRERAGLNLALSSIRALAKPAPEKADLVEVTNFRTQMSNPSTGLMETTYEWSKPEPTDTAKCEHPHRFEEDICIHCCDRFIARDGEK